MVTQKNGYYNLNSRHCPYEFSLKSTGETQISCKTTNNGRAVISKDPPQPAAPGAPFATPSMLHFIQLQLGGYQLTRMTLGALPGFPVILNDF